ncbi:hypothetical protein Psta_1824 [Pirellula staleyi DSM 6068]|uniref:Type VI secretion system component TssM1 N-terminal domain-containing protein n=1 Tax=Pirellula staleyi (strain ATCC 27377 / DSM 6068 / ICPB 4128) TaxID=530564 RepID=D2QZL5_PIRSD|nr:type VI secretion protein IcmF/TssM N-terminal domain-containing protein [Pirellula staleyi]ADB16498.1 hypothetical protein Psta_1824 [Pirellula staleyi DSM 6068]
MSDEAPAEETKPEKKPEKKAKAPAQPGFFARLMAWPSKITTAGCASCLTSLVLTILLITVWIVFLVDSNNVPWRHSMSWLRVTLEVMLVITIPIVLYYAIRLWMEGDKSPFPDIDYAWQTGLEQLSRSGLSLSSAPLFLIVGTPGINQERSLMRASGVALRMRELPDGPAPLHWYAGPDGIYLFCTQASWASSLAALVEKRRNELIASGAPPTDLSMPQNIVPAPVAPINTTASTPAPAKRAERNRGTIMLDQFVMEKQSLAAAAEASAQSSSQEVDDKDDFVPSVSSSVSDQPALLSPQESSRQQQRLEYVCQLLRRGRRPLCPLNGVLTLLPFDVFQATQRETQEMQRAVRADLTIIQNELTVRCPVTALITGMQNQRGFRELVRRVGRERAATQRFGRRFDVRMIATAEQVTNLCGQITGVFEDWIHTLFREAEALSRPGNTRLYGLLCQMRSNLAGVLREVLSGGFGYESNQKNPAEPIAFSGCYFAATGDTEDQQAFVRGVFEKLTEEQEEVEWTRLSVQINDLYQFVGILCGLASVVILVTVFVVFLVRLFS